LTTDSREKRVAMNETQRDRAETTSPHFAAASVEEIRYAEYLRRQIEHRYLNKSDRASEHIGMSASYVGAD